MHSWVITVIQGLVGGAIAGGAAVGVMRSDIRWLKEGLKDVRENLSHVHHRIDDILSREKR